MSGALFFQIDRRIANSERGTMFGPQVWSRAIFRFERFESEMPRASDDEGRRPGTETRRETATPGQGQASSFAEKTN
jgi:hypothetical protein